jgi:hypothetical protein
MYTYRIIFFCITLLAVFVSPWWLVAALCVVGLIKYESYWECISIAFVLDSLYGAPVPLWHGFPYVATVTACVLFVVAHYAKIYIRLQ